MSFLWPFGLLALLGVPAAVLIALWRAKRRDVDVPSLMLWQRLAEKISDTGQKHRAVIDMPLILAGMVALLLGLAAAGPMLASRPAGGRTFLLVLDRSASMQMKQNDSSRWIQAMRQLQKLLGQLTDDDAVHLATSPAGDDVRVGPMPPSEAAELLRAMRPTDRSADLADDVARAVASAESLKPFSMIVCTDSPDVLPPSMPAIGVGGPADNLFFTRFGFSGGTILLGVGNAGKPRTANLQLIADGRMLEQRKISLANSAESTEMFGGTDDVENARLLEARLVADDSLQADNYFYAVREQAQRLRVMLIGHDNAWLESAIAVHDGIELIRSAKEASADSYDLLIYNGVAPKNLTGRTPAVVIDPPESFGGIAVGGAIRQPKITSVSGDPLTDDTDLADIAVETARGITAAAGVLVASDKGPLVVRDGNVICLAFSIGRENTDWMLKAGFPVFWAKMVEKLSSQTRATLVHHQIGSRASVRISERNATLKRTKPAGEPASKPPAGEFVFRPDLGGVYELTDGADTRLFAFNMLDSRESSTTGSWKSIDHGTIGNAASRAAGGAAAALMLAPVLVSIGLALAVAQWCLKR